MKRADIPDGHVIDLAMLWHHDPRNHPGVVEALVREGVPVKLALAKVEHLTDRGLLEYGVSANYAWPRAAERAR